MRIYPAIDLRGGRCVRLEQGDPDRETTFGDDPTEMAHRWVSEGAEWLHVVDLDGALSGNRKNADAIAAILDGVDVPVQIGGGMRSFGAIRSAIELGVERVVVGTAALEDPELVRNASEEFPGRVAVSIDTRDGRVATRGWKMVTDVLALDLARDMEDRGACLIVHTDIARDGMFTGANVAATRDLAESLTIPVIASGGVSTVADVAALAAIEDVGIEGVVIGRALYTGRVSLTEALAVARRQGTET